jgi:hypothetical protein
MNVLRKSGEHRNTRTERLVHTAHRHGGAELGLQLAAEFPLRQGGTFWFSRLHCGKTKELFAHVPLNRKCESKH